MVTMLRRVMLLSIENPNPAHLERMRSALAAATDNVDGVVSSVVHDALPINKSPCTFVWETVFADQAALDVYRDHPYHTDVLIPLFTAIQFNAMTAFIDSGA
ncbi:MAG: Dabb family protein [Acidimicrobiales bacterium]